MNHPGRKKQADRETCRKNHAYLHRFTEIENLGTVFTGFAVHFDGKHLALTFWCYFGNLVEKVENFEFNPPKCLKHGSGGYLAEKG